MSDRMSGNAGPSAKALHIFEELKREVTPAKLLTLREDIDGHLLQLQKLARTNEMTPIDLAEKVAAGLHQLLDGLGGFDEEQQADILGAALYFISTQDEISDTSSILGLDDDAAIFNHVVGRIGRSDLKVDP